MLLGREGRHFKVVGVVVVARCGLEPWVESFELHVCWYKAFIIMPPASSVAVSGGNVQ